MNLTVSGLIDKALTVFDADDKAYACVSSICVGVIESLGPSLFLDGLEIPAPYQLKDAIAFTLLVLILIFRPAGILGERLREKKA